MSNCFCLFHIAGKNKMEEYPQLSRFCYTAEELHKEYGLSMEGVLAKDISDKDLSDDQYITVFKQLHKPGAKIFLNHVQPRLYEDCRLLYHKVYQAPPSCGEITTKFARCYAFEKCHAATKKPADHQVAWARFGENVLNTCASQKGGLERKVESWRRANGVSNETLPSSAKKPRLTQSGSNICTEADPLLRRVEIPDYVADLESIVERAPQTCLSIADRMKELRASLKLKNEALLRYEGSNAVAKRLKDDIEAFELQLAQLKQQSPCDADEIRELEADLGASRRMLRRLGVSDDMDKLEKEVELQQV